MEKVLTNTSEQELYHGDHYPSKPCSLYPYHWFLPLKSWGIKNEKNNNLGQTVNDLEGECDSQEK